METILLLRAESEDTRKIFTQGVGLAQVPVGVKKNRPRRGVDSSGILSKFDGANERGSVDYLATTKSTITSLRNSSPLRKLSS